MRVPLRVVDGGEGASDREIRLVECGVIRTSPKTPLALRLREIFEGVSELMERSDWLSVI